MSGATRISRRGFVALTTAVLGSIMGLALGLPAIGFLIEPALKARKTDAWIKLGNAADYLLDTPTPFSFTRSQRNGWETTFTVYGGFVIRRSQALDDFLVLSSRCTHLSCRVNWNAEAQNYQCPCHDAKFSLTGEVLSGPPPAPLSTYEYKVEEGVLSIHLVEG